MIIRLAEETDIPEMARIRSAECADEAFWIDRIARYRSGDHSPRQALPERAILVACDEGAVLGFIAGHRTRRLDCDGELQWLNVDVHHRGRGIADGLIARMGEWFLAQEAGRICVNVAPDNRAARQVYARCGARALNDQHDQWMIWEDARRMGRDARGRDHDAAHPLPEP